MLLVAVLGSIVPACRSDVPPTTIPLVGRLLEDGDERSQEDANVEEDRPILDVIEVVLCALVDGHVTAQAVDLRPAGHSRFLTMALHVPWDFGTELPHVLRLLRARANKAHVAHKHVDKVRQLVYGEPTQKSTQTGASRVIGNCPIAAILTGTVIHHCTKLDDGEGLTVTTYTFLDEERRAGRVEANQQCNNKQRAR